MAGGIGGFFLWPEEEVQVQAWPAGVTLLLHNLQTLPYAPQLPVGLWGRGLGAPLCWAGEIGMRGLALSLNSNSGRPGATT